jgi:hypothetical protein
MSANHLIILKLFQIFFENLTTTIAQIEIYLNDNPVNRNITFKLRELADFVEHLHGVRTGKITARKPKRMRKKTGNMQTPIPIKSNVVTVYNDLIKESTVAAYILSLSINMDQLDHDLTQVINTMGSIPLEQHLHMDKCCFIQMLTVSGLQWNENSQAKSRGFTQVSLATIPKSLIIVKYRENLLKSCQGTLSCTRI